MKYPLLSILFFLLLFFISPAFSQVKKYDITGTVQDSADHHPLPVATVYVKNLKDSSVAAFAFTDDQGHFILKNIPADRVLSFMIFYTGYRNFYKELKNIQVDTLKMGVIPLAMSANALNTVTITGAKPPIVIKGDTVEFNASSFHTRPNSALAGLLKKLPGVEVDKNGSITANGEKVDKIMVNGKAFFGKDPQIALQNLPAAIVDKVQITDTKTRKEEVLGLPATGTTKTINVTLKKGKDHGFFGRAYAGYGTGKHYDASALMNYFNGDQQISLLGAANNINQVGFSMGEIMGLFSRGNRRMMYGSDGSFAVNGIRLGGGGTGLKRTHTAGVNYNDNFGKHLFLNGSYFYGNIRNDNETKVARQNILPDSIFLYHSDNFSHTDDQNHRINLNLHFDDDSLWNIYYEPSIDIGIANSMSSNHAASTNKKGVNINESTSSYQSHSNSIYFNNDLSVFRKFKKDGQGINLSIHGYSGRTQNKDYNRFRNLYYTGSARDDSADQNILQRKTTDRYRAKIEFDQPVSKSITLNVAYQMIWQKGLNNKNTFDYDTNTKKYNLMDSVYSNKFRSGTLTQTPSLGMVFKADSGRWRASLNADLNFIGLNHYSYTYDMAYKKHQFFVSPQVHITRRTKNKASIRFYYSSYILQPNITQLLPVADNTNPLYILKGNPNLKPSVRNNIGFSYNKFNFKTGNNIWGSLDYSASKNDIVSVTSYDDQLRQLTTYTNVNGNKNVSLYLGLSKSKKNKNNYWRIRVNTMGRYNLNHAFVNKTAYASNHYSFSLRPSVTYGKNDLFDIEPSYRLSYQYANYHVEALNNRENIVQQAMLSGTLYWPGKITWATDVNYTYNSNVAPGFSKAYWLWNASVGLDLFKDRRATLQLSVHDLLDQNISVQRNITDTYIEDRQTTILHRYFMLKLIYHLRKVGSKKKKGPPPPPGMLFF